MSPTLLEVTVAVLLLWLAWQIGLLIAPHIIRYFRITFRRTDVSSVGEAPTRPEKNVTPRSESNPQ